MPRWTPSDLRAYEMKTASQHNAAVVGECRSEGDQELARAAKQPESALHDKIIDYCNQQWPRWKFIHARMDRASTIAVGCQDFTIFAPGRVLCVEVKKVGGKLSPEQLAWKLEMERLGHTVYVVESFEQFLVLLS